MKRAQITFTVEPEDVGEEVAKLLEIGIENLEKQVEYLNETKKSITSSFPFAEKMKRGSGRIDYTRQQLAKIDIRLMECQNILATFADINLKEFDDEEDE